MADCTYTFKTAEGEVTIKGMAEMKAFLALNGVGAIDGAKAPMFSQRAFHGTPHRGINKFSTDKIGTGEGAQAYGWGLYFAGRKEIGEFYRSTLAPKNPPTEAQILADPAVVAAQARVDAAGEELDRLGTDNQQAVAEWTAANDALYSARKSVKGGQLYEVEIPEDSEMLLWDKPLSEQPEAVRAAVDKLFENGALDDGSKKLIESQGMRQDLKGKTLYELLATSDNLAIDGTGRAASLALAEAGIKGIKYLDGTSRDAGGGSYNYVVFSGDDVAIQQAFYSKRAPVVGSRFKLPGSTAVDVGRIRLQDDVLRMKRVIEAVKQQGGTVGEAQNFYDANTLMPGRIQAEIDDFKDKVVRPMLDKAVKYEIDLDELSLYAYAQHAEERNQYIASINPRMPDGGSGMTTADAKAILQQVQAGGKAQQFDELHKDLMSITSTTRLLMLSEGLITQDEFDSLDGAYANYIPLRGLENVDEGGRARPGVGRGVNVRGGETVRAMGRRSRASDLIENVIRDYERVITRVERNDVGKVLLDFVLSNPDPDLWGVDIERNKPSFNKATGLVQYTKQVEKGEDTIGVKVGGQQVYIKLVDKDLTRALRQAWKDEVSGLERAVVATTGWWNNWMRNVLTRYNPAFAAINIPRDALWSGTTAALAELGPKGLVRYLAAYGKATMASTRAEAGVSGTTNVMFGNPQIDKLYQEFRAAGGITGGFYMRDLDTIQQELRDEMLLAGAKARNPWEMVKTLPPYKAAKLTLRGLEFLGSASENATRFALYMAAKESGKSSAQAAILAKDGTTNFNRKGEFGGVLNNMYLFFNAGVQGTTQLVKVLRSPAVQASMAGVAGVGMMLALYGASGGGEDEDGEKYWDKIPSYVKERNLVIMLSPGEPLADGIQRVGKRGRYITIPVQYGFNIFPNMGYMMADVFRNSEDPKRGVTPTKAALHMTSVIFGSVNPFGGSVDVSDGVQVLLAASPTLVDLPIQIINERGTFGRPSAPMAWDRRPDSERMFASQQGTVPAKIAKALNELGGGDEAKAGSILGIETSITPGTIDTLIRGTTGGLGAFVEQTATSVSAMAGDKDIKAGKVPFLNKFYGEVDEDANIRSAGERMREVKRVVNEDKDRKRFEKTQSEEKSTAVDRMTAVRDLVDAVSTDLDSDLKMQDGEAKLLALAKTQKGYEKAQTEMRKLEISLVSDDSLTDAEKRLYRQRIQAERDRLATKVNKAYLNLPGQ
jgi:hypothetical protein